jgi:hypothetical protein
MRRGGCRRAAAASPWRRFRPGSNSGEWWQSADEQEAVEASLGPRGDAQQLARRCERADGCAHRGDGNGGRWCAVRAGRLTGGLFIGGRVHGGE